MSCQKVRQRGFACANISFNGYKVVVHELPTK